MGGRQHKKRPNSRCRISKTKTSNNYNEMSASASAAPYTQPHRSTCLCNITPEELEKQGLEETPEAYFHYDNPKLCYQVSTAGGGFHVGNVTADFFCLSIDCADPANAMAIAELHRTGIELYLGKPVESFNYARVHLQGDPNAAIPCLACVIQDESVRNGTVAPPMKLESVSFGPGGFRFTKKQTDAEPSSSSSVDVAVAAAVAASH